MSIGTVFSEAHGYLAQKENESKHCLQQINAYPAGPVVELAATDKINWKLGPRIRIHGAGGAVVLSSLPQIADASGPVELILEGAHATFTVTLSSEAALPGSNIKLAGGGTFALGLGHILHLVFSIETGFWLEIGRSVNS